MTIRRTLVAVYAITGTWSLVLLVTGGFVFQIAGLRLSSQMARGPLAIALLTPFSPFSGPLFRLLRS
jgi:hypothetical protein